MLVSLFCAVWQHGVPLKKKQGNKKNTATNMVQIKIMMAHTANILPAINLIVDILC
jgi:hypothetical protein